MTTKKQRREQVAAKRAAYDAETKRLGLAAQQREHAKLEQKQFDINRGVDKRKKKHESAIARELDKILSKGASYGHSQNMLSNG